MVNLPKKSLNKYGFIIFISSFLVICTIRDILASSQIGILQTTKEKTKKNSSNVRKKVTFIIPPEEENNRNNNTIDPAMLTVENLLNYNIDMQNSNM